MYSGSLDPIDRRDGQKNLNNNIDVVPEKTRSPHPWMRQPATAREDTAAPRLTWTTGPSSTDLVIIIFNARQIFMQITYVWFLFN